MPRIAVLLHVYYPDLLPGLVRCAANFPAGTELLVTMPEAHREEVEQKLATALPDMRRHCRTVPNLGRDIAPMLVEFGERLQAFDLVCKLHTKKSTHQAEHHSWRESLLANLAGSRETVDEIIAGFADNPTVGLYYPGSGPHLKRWMDWDQRQLDAVADIAADRGLPNNVETGIDLVIELQLQGGFSAIFHAMDEQDVIRIMQHPLAMIETDGDPVAWGDGYPHPRSYGAFPRVLARYVRELGVLSLEEAVRKMTSMPADQYNQRERGRIVEGAFADIVVFNADTIQDQATYTDPHRYPTGIEHVVTNGQFVIKSGSLTGNRPGVWIKGPARPDRVTSN